MNRALFMTGQQMMEVGKPVHRIVNVQHRAAGITEYTIYILKNQTAKQNFRTGYNLRLPTAFPSISSFDLQCCTLQLTITVVLLFSMIKKTNKPFVSLLVDEKTRKLIAHIPKHRDERLYLPWYHPGSLCVSRCMPHEVRTSCSISFIPWHVNACPRFPLMQQQTYTFQGNSSEVSSSKRDFGDGCSRSVALCTKEPLALRPHHCRLCISLESLYV